MQRLRELGNALLDLALPPRCHLCRCLLNSVGPLHLCPDCYGDLPFLAPPCCSRCGKPFAGSGPHHPCSACLLHPPPWEQARAALVYERGCRDLIHAFKYRQRSQLRRPLALLTAERLAEFARDCRADYLVPVPLHRKRLRSRGFNQSVLLAELLAQHWQLPLLRQGLRRIRWTTPQIELHADERAANLRDAFAVSDPQQISGARLLLVDDVFTTGATLAECSRTLLKAGATAVCAVTVARAPDPA